MGSLRKRPRERERKENLEKETISFSFLEEEGSLCKIPVPASGNGTRSCFFVFETRFSFF